MAPKTQFLVVLVALFGVNIGAGWHYGSDMIWRPFAWVVLIVLFVLALLVIGKRMTGKYRGVLIDNWNAVSLSRLQLVMWLTLVATGVLTAVIANVMGNEFQPWALNIPDQIWALLGISGTSAVAAPFIEQTRTDSPTQPNVIRNIAPAWADIFLGDFEKSASQVDMSKVQQFFFTTIVVATYALRLGYALATQNKVTFPEIDNGFVYLLTISHAAYLTSKTTQT